MARVLFSYARHSMDICGFTVDDVCIAENTNTFCGLPLAPFSKVQNVFDPHTYRIILAMGFIQMNELREQKHNEATEKGYAFASYIHESVIIHDDVLIDDDCIILDHVSIHPGSKIGRGTFISSNVNIGHDCLIDPYNYITSGVSIAGGCQIGAGCFLGINSSVAHGVRLGARTFLAANTLLNKNSEEDSVYLSEPGQLFRLKSKSFLTFSHMLD
jgi:sugar O-acyltransferase (sialic acid O-acetyltransferase NeuD family)